MEGNYSQAKRWEEGAKPRGVQERAVESQDVDHQWPTQAIEII
jgi:hypothetical protein